MGKFGLTELIIILVIVLLIFGPKRLKNIGSDLGNAIKGFRSAVTDEDAKAEAAEAGVIEGEAVAKDSTAKKEEAKQDTNV